MTKFIPALYQNKYGQKKRPYIRTKQKTPIQKVRPSLYKLANRQRYLHNLKNSCCVRWNHKFITIDVTNQIKDISNFTQTSSWIYLDKKTKKLIIDLWEVGNFDITYLLGFKIHRYGYWEVYNTYIKNGRCYIELFDCWNDGYSRKLRPLP